MQRNNILVLALLLTSGLALLVGVFRLASAPAPAEQSESDDVEGLVGELWSGGKDARDGVGVVELSGVIQFGSEDMGPFSTVSPTDLALRKLRAFAKDNKVKAVVLRVNSPGGSLAASQEIADEVKRLVNDLKKPVVVSMGDVAASGGYYVSAPASKILAQPGTLTGSIGVITSGLNLAGLMEKHGVKVNSITSGPNKDTLAYWREPRPDEIALMQKLVDDAYGQFLEQVATGRHIDIEVLRPNADGRVLLGSQALELGLVDALGSFRDAVRLACELSGLDPDDPHLIRDSGSWMDRVRLNFDSRLGSWLGARAPGTTGAQLLAASTLPVAYLYLPPASLRQLVEVLP
ncbi:MAG: signal peptide peptidase SppA [Pseudomonadota bacterium]